MSLAVKQLDEPPSLHVTAASAGSVSSRQQPSATFTGIVVAGMLLLSCLLVRLAAQAAGQPRDLLQDYVSARQLLAGQSLYPELAPFRDEFARPPEGSEPYDYISVNAHPPVSVLLALPVAHLSYGAASWTWEISGLIAYVAMWCLILSGVGSPATTRSGQLISGLLILAFPPLTQSVVAVSMSPYISLLLVAVWSCYRQGRRGWAAALLAIAVALKLYPALLIGTFLIRRDWRTAATATLGSIGIVALTLPVLGMSAYQEYLSVLTSISWWISTPWNLSLAGFFGRLFAAGPFSESIFTAPALAAGLTVAACGGLVAVLVALALGAERRQRPEASIESFDLLYSCAILVLLLVSPLSWVHYAGATALAWCVVAARDRWEANGSPMRRRWLAAFATITLLVPFAIALWGHLIQVDTFLAWTVRSPLTSLLLFSINTYIWLGMLVLGLSELRQVGRACSSQDRRVPSSR